MKKVFAYLILTVLVACGNNNNKEKKEVLVIPPNALFIINSEPVPAAYKVDTTQQWVIIDSTAALKALLKMVEDNFKRAVAQQKAQDAPKLKQ